MGRNVDPLKKHDLRLDEMETTFTIVGTNRSVVRVYSNDPILIKKIERAGAVAVRTLSDGGKFYDLPSSQLTIRKPPRRLSPEEKRLAANRLAVSKGRHTAS